MHTCFIAVLIFQSTLGDQKSFYFYEGGGGGAQKVYLNSLVGVSKKFSILIFPIYHPPPHKKLPLPKHIFKNLVVAIDWLIISYKLL
jgi:hypothetical protein